MVKLSSRIYGDSYDRTKICRLRLVRTGRTTPSSLNWYSIRSHKSVKLSPFAGQRKKKEFSQPKKSIVFFLRHWPPKCWKLIKWHFRYFLQWLFGAFGEFWFWQILHFYHSFYFDQLERTKFGNNVTWTVAPMHFGWAGNKMCYFCALPLIGGTVLNRIQFFFVSKFAVNGAQS